MKLRVEADEIVLVPEQLTAPLVQDGPLLVHRGVATGDLFSAVESSRALRDQKVHGLTE